MNTQPENKAITLKKIFIILVLILITGLIALFISRNIIKNFLNHKTIYGISQKLKRKISYSNISYSLESITIEDFKITERDENKTFAKAKKIKMKFNLKEMITQKKDFEIDRLYIENAEINLNYINGWNFSDILEFFSNNKKNLSETYFVRETEFSNSDIIIKKDGIEYLLKNLNLIIKHQKGSEIFDISFNFDLYINFQATNIFFKSNSSMLLDISDKINKIDISRFELSEITYGRLKAERIISKFYIDSLKQESNFDINIKSLSGIKELELFIKANETYRKIYSRNINIGDSIDLNIKLLFSNSNFSLNINSTDFSILSDINLLNNTHLLNFKTSNVYIETNSVIKNPNIKSNLSEMMSSMIKDLIIKYEELILKLTHNNRNL